MEALPAWLIKFCNSKRFAMKVALLMTTCATAALCQQAQIAGLIRDPAELSVSGAVINVRNEQTGGHRETRSNSSGFYSVASLSPGTYRILVRRQGFETIVREDVKLEVGDNARIDFALRIGDSQTVVTVKGGPPLMNTEDASIGTVIGRDLIDEMPLNGRGIQSLIELTPGTEAVPVTASNSGQFSVNGQRSVSNYFTVDGVSANFGAGDPSTGVLGSGVVVLSQAGGALLPANNLMGTFSNLVSPDALQEFRIQTSTFAPEFGHMPGAQIGLITRSGTTRYSGSLFEYFRNDVFDSNDWFSDRLGLSKAPLRFNNFGGTLGGPLHLHHGDDRTFFFFSFEDLTMRQPQPPILVAVPDAQARLAVSPLSAPIYDALPLPNLPASSVNATAPGWAGFDFGFSQPVDQQTWGLRVDHYFSDKLIGFARFSLAPSDETSDLGSSLATGGSPLNPLHVSAGTGMLTAGITEAVNSAIVNEARVNFSWQTVSAYSLAPPLNGAKPFPDSLLLPPGDSPQNSEASIDDFSDPGVPVIQVGLASISRSRQIQGVDQLSYTKGLHHFKFGLDYRRFTISAKLPQTDNLYSFTDLPDGEVASLLEFVTPSSAAYLVPDFSVYAQDTWHLLPRLTITYGLRWELYPAPRPTGGEVSVYNPLPSPLDFSALSTATPGTPFYPTQYTNFAPRIGLALQLLGSGDNKLVLRAGAGTFYDSAQGELENIGATTTNIYPYANFPVGTFPTGASPFPGSGPQFSPITVSGGYRTPRTYEWNTTLEQSIGSQTVSAAYVGSAGRRLVGAVTDNSLMLPGPISPNYPEILGNDFSSSYNALQLQFNRRMSKRVQALISYTWSHSIDNRSDAEGTSLETQDPNVLADPNQNRGDSDFDIRQSLHGALYFALPAPAQGWSSLPLRNWTASTIFFARTAMPTNLVFGTTSVYGGIDVRPDVVPGQPLYLYGSEYPGGKSFNLAAFVPPPAGVEQGDLGRNVLRGFGAWQADFALHRTFRLSEHTSLQFRGEAFNVLNHPNFANPTLIGTQATQISPGFNTSQSPLSAGLSPSGTLGQLNQLFQIGGPRSLQFALRLAF
jgi:Carboxypeptidase regulatory-like domain